MFILVLHILQKEIYWHIGINRFYERNSIFFCRHNGNNLMYESISFLTNCIIVLKCKTCVYVITYIYIYLKEREIILNNKMVKNIYKIIINITVHLYVSIYRYK